MIERDELLEMAKESGFCIPRGNEDLFTPYLEHLPITDVVVRFYNAILERAALGFEDDEWKESRYTGRAASIKIRALKTKE